MYMGINRKIHITSTQQMLDVLQDIKDQYNHLIPKIDSNRIPIYKSARMKMNVYNSRKKNK
jgi:hypothetical protein